MKIYHIEMVGKKYPLVFSATASEKLKDYFGNMSEDAVNSIGMKDINALLGILMDAGRLYCKLTNVDCPDPLECQPTDVLDVAELTGVVKLIQDVITGGNEREVEVADSKNMETTQGK